MAAVALEADIFECDETTKSIDPSTSELSSHMVSSQSKDNSAASFLHYEDRDSYENVEDFPNPASSAFGQQLSLQSLLLKNTPCPTLVLMGVEIREVPVYQLFDYIGNRNRELLSGESWFIEDDESLELNNNINEVEEPSVPTTEGKDMATSVQDLNAADNAHDI